MGKQRDKKLGIIWKEVQPVKKSWLFFFVFVLLMFLKRQ